MNPFNWLFRKRTTRKFRKKGLGLEPSPVDPRDFKVAAPASYLNSHFLKTWSIKNQGRFNSCTAFAVCSAGEAVSSDIQYSERYNWYYSRKDYMGTFPKNTGVYIRDALKVAQKKGLAPELLCPYDPDNMNTVPGMLADSFARFYRIGEYSRCWTLSDIKASLTSDHPVVIGMSVWREFMAQDTLDAKLPDTPEFIGGHAMMVYGFDEVGLYVANSWGPNWGAFGRARIPYSIADRLDILFEAWSVTNLKRRDDL